MEKTSYMYIWYIDMVYAINIYISYMGLSENVVYPEKPNGFHDHYPVSKWLFHWGIPHFQTYPYIYIYTLW